MNHDIVVEKFGVRLRPVAMDDALFIYNLRRTPELSQYIGDFDSRLSVHVNWLERYFERKNDYYFIIELHSGKQVGTISIYDITEQTGNWGRWIIQHPIPAAPASAWLIYFVAFEVLALPEVFSNSVLANKHIVSFHDNCGLTRTRIEPAALTIKGVSYDVIIHTALRENWHHIQKKLEAPAMYAERLLSEL